MPLTCLLSLVTGFHFSLTACFTYDSEADHTALGGCFAAHCAAVLAILSPLLLVLLESHVRATALPSPSSRLAYRLVSVIVRSTQGCGLCSSASASLDFVTISALRWSVFERIAGRSFNTMAIAKDAASASVRYLPSDIVLDFHPSRVFYAAPTPKVTSLASVVLSDGDRRDPVREASTLGAGGRSEASISVSP
jgi:hypothetical protein